MKRKVNLAFWFASDCKSHDDQLQDGDHPYFEHGVYRRCEILARLLPPELTTNMAAEGLAQLAFTLHERKVTK